MNRKSAPEKLLTAVELELMKILWTKGEGSVNDVLEVLPKERKLAYTSVSTILRILEQKNMLGSRKEGRGHIYRPLLTRSAYEKLSLQHMVTKVFDGTASSLVRRLLETDGMSEEDLIEIQKLIQQKVSPK